MSERVGVGAAALALGKAVRTVSRWKNQLGAPFGDDGLVVLEELRSWAIENELLERTPEAGPRTALERAAATAIAPAASNDVVRDKLTREDLSDEDLKVFDAFVSGNPSRMLALSAHTDEKRLRRIGLVAATWRAVEDAKSRDMENKRAFGELAPVGEFREFYGGQAALIRGAFQVLPGKFATLLIGKTGEEIMAIVETELDEVLEGLAATFTPKVKPKGKRRGKVA